MGTQLKSIGVIVLVAIVAYTKYNSSNMGESVVKNELIEEGEIYFKDIKQLTFEGENAEAYFSSDYKELIYQSKSGDLEADQIFIMNVDGTNNRMVSVGGGAATCAYFLPDGSRIIYSSTRLGGEKSPTKISVANGKYVWSIFETYDIFSANPDGSDIVRLTDTPGYDAEATVSPDGKTIVFTSVRDGDLDIYTMDIDGSNVKRLTFLPGYDGGPFYSWDGKKIIYRAYHTLEKDEHDEFKDFLSQGLVQPTRVDIFIMDADGKNKVQLTDNAKANFAPFFHPDNERIIFASNMDSEDGRTFDLYMINVYGRGLKRITFNPSFDGFPMFTKDGKKLVFASNRNAANEGDTNIFIADFVEPER